MTDVPLAPFPIYHTTLIGRSIERSDVMRLLQNPTTRLVTLVGESGAGKTRLALEVAATMDGAFPDGIVFISLAPVQEARFVLTTLASALEIQESTDQDLFTTLSQALCAKKMLLILDNVEQVRAAARDIERLIQATNHLHVLVTSQIRLALADEQVYLIPPLSTPPGLMTLNPTHALEYPAIALFVDRLQVVQPHFQLTDSNVRDVRQICQLLDGFPLAIELVAAHSAQLTPADLLFLLRNHIGSSNRPHSVSSRTAILEPVLRWCVGQLPDVARRLVETLGIFSGGWILDGAREILAPDLPLTSVEDAFAVLVQKNLVLQETLPGRGTRYVVLDVVRAYSNACLKEQNLQHILQERYVCYYFKLAEASLPAKEGKQQAEWLKWLDDDYHNIRSSLYYALAHPDTNLFTRFVAHLGWFWRMRCYFDESLFWLSHALDQKNILPENHAMVFYQYGILLWMQGNSEQSLHYLNKSLSIYEAKDDKKGYTETLSEIGNVHYMIGDISTAQEIFEKCIELWKELNNKWAYAILTSNLGYIYFISQNFECSLTILREARVLANEIDDISLKAVISSNMGWVMHAQKKARKAMKYFREALDIHYALSNDYCIAEQVEGIAAAYGLLDDHAVQAATLLGMAEALRQRLNTPLMGSDLDYYQTIMASVRNQLSEDQFTAAWEKGMRMSVDEAVAMIR